VKHPLNQIGADLPKKPPLKSTRVMPHTKGTLVAYGADLYKTFFTSSNTLRHIINYCFGDLGHAQHSLKMPNNNYK